MSLAFRKAFHATAVAALTLSCATTPGTTNEKTASSADKTEQLSDTVLIEGDSLGRWDGNPEIWSVKGGTLVARVTESTKVRNKPSYLIYRGQTFADFELHFSYRIVEGRVNSGIQYRSTESADGNVSGYQADIDTANRWTGILVEMNQRKFLAMRGERTETTVPLGYEVKGKLSSADELATHLSPNGWNHYVVIARGTMLQHIVNGYVMSEAIDVHPSAARSGILAFQMNTGNPGTIEFKDVRIRNLAPAPLHESVAQNEKEIVWFDRELTFAGDRASEANALLDWTQPVDYANGSLELRFIVKEKPTDVPVWIELVMWKHHLGGEHKNLSCLPAKELRTTGIYTCSLRPSAQAGERGAEFFASPFNVIQHSAKLSDNGARTTTELSGEHAPLRGRYTAVLVPRGKSFSGWQNYP